MDLSELLAWILVIKNLECVFFFIFYSCCCHIMLLVKAEAIILRGPHEDLEGYLEAVDMLKSTVQHFSSNKSFKGCDGVMNHINSLLAKAILKLEEEFRQLLATYRFLPWIRLLVYIFFFSTWCLHILENFFLWSCN